MENAEPLLGHLTGFTGHTDEAVEEVGEETSLRSSDREFTLFTNADREEWVSVCDEWAPALIWLAMVVDCELVPCCLTRLASEREAPVDEEETGRGANPGGGLTAGVGIPLVCVCTEGGRPP